MKRLIGLLTYYSIRKCSQGNKTGGRFFCLITGPYRCHLYSCVTKGKTKETSPCLRLVLKASKYYTIINSFIPERGADCLFNEKNYNTIKIVVAVTYLFMIIMNGLANSIPINGVTTGEVSGSYPDLFAPASITFAIWGLIYLLLAAYTLYQFGFFRQDKGGGRAELFTTIGIYFSISSVANGLWILAWHYYSIGFSLLLMLVILVNLILIANRLSREEFNLQEKLLIRLPFSIYFGWITVATIANITTYLVSIGWGGFGISEQIWTILILFVGVAIAGARMIRDRDVAYGLVIIWAYAGIWIKHASESGFAGQYPAVISAVTVCILLLLVAEAYLLYPDFWKKKTARIKS